jgi:hypothetical protein
MIPVLFSPWCAGLEASSISPAVCNEPNTSDTGQYTTYTDNPPSSPTFTIGSGVATSAHGAGGCTHFHKTGSDLNSGRFLVTCDVTARSGSGAFINTGVGIVKDGTEPRNVIFADHEAVTNVGRIAWFKAGAYHTAGSVSLTLTPPFSMALASDGLAPARVQMWAKTSGGVWRFITSADLSADFVWSGFTWTGWKAGFGTSCPNAASWSFDNLKCAQRFR